MANQEHLDIFTKRGVEDWNQWRGKHPDILPDLSRADIRGQLIGVDLSRVNLSGAKLIRTDIFITQLRGADLSEARVLGTDLSYANLSGAILHKTDLKDIDLSYANLSYANLSYADLRLANLSYANLHGALQLHFVGDTRP